MRVRGFVRSMGGVRDTCAFLKILGFVLGDTYDKDYCILGFMLGSLFMKTTLSDLREHMPAGVHLVPS